MRAILENLPRFLWGRPWSSLVPWRLQSSLEHLASERAYQRSPPPSLRVRSGPPEATLLFAGDLALHRWSAGESASRRFRGVRQVFHDVDFRLVNLETVLTTHDEPAGKIGSFLKAPPDAISCLKFLDTDVVSSANNHALDFGPVGLQECGELLGSLGIGWCGVDTHRGDAAVPGAWLQTINGVQVGIVGATDHFGGIPGPVGPAPVWFDSSGLRRGVRALRDQCHVVVVQLHWGYEDAVYPLRWHRDFARQLVEEGADIVCCHHAHVVMGVERWGRGVIAHGLGNFSFGFGTPRLQHPLGQFGILLRAAVDRSGLLLADVIPVHTDSSGAVRTELLGCPGFDRLCDGLADQHALDGIENTRVAHELARLSAELRGRIANADGVGLLERQKYLMAPRQDWLLSRAETSRTAAWRKLAGWLKDFRSLDPERVQRFEFAPPPAPGALARHADRRLMSGRWP